MVLHVRSLGGVFLCAFCVACIFSGSFSDAVADSLDMLTPESVLLPGISQDSVSIESSFQRSSPPQASDTSGIVTLEKMIVTASRRQRLLETSQSLSIIKPSEWIGTNKTVADVVAEQTGVQTRRYGGTGSFQTVSIRGVQGSEVIVLLDGIPLNSAMGGAVDLGAISPDQIGEIEVYKGITPSRFGGNCLGGVINLKSKSKTRSQSVDLQSSIGSYGYQKYSAGVSRSYNDLWRLYASLGYLQSENDWQYRSNNRTPYDRSDDTKERMTNAFVKTFDVRVQPSIYLPNGSIFSTAISYSNLNKGNPAGMAHINPTSQMPKDQLTIYARLSPADKGTGMYFLISPEISYNKLEQKTFWTSLDQDMGTSHGGISTAPNSYAEFKTAEQSAQISCVADIGYSENLSGEVTLTGKYSTIVTNSEAASFTHGDWPGSAQELTISADADGAVPFGIISIGTTLGGSAKIARNATNGGKNNLLETTIFPKDTIENSFAARSGIHLRVKDALNIFVNAGFYSDLPKLRERFGTNGNVIANPLLKKEKGTTAECGLRYSWNNLFFESTCFWNRIEDGIVFLSDGTFTKPVNLAESSSRGIELALTTQLACFLRTELRGTFQKAENFSELNNYRGKGLPNEPSVTLLGKVTVEPIKGISVSYWLDYKSAFWRDYGNTHRMPGDRDLPGINLHNAQIKWNAPGNLEFDISIRNVNGISLDSDDLVYYECGSEWTLYPSNEWSFTAGYSF